MSIFLGILLTLVVLLIVVMIHELGHFITARLTGMKVEEFGIGIPPRAYIFFTDKKWTEYTLNWLPIGGFVRIVGEDPRSSDSDIKWSFITKPWTSRVLVLVAGVTMNFFLAFAIFTGLFLYGTKPMAIIPIEWSHSKLLPSDYEAIENWYITHNGILVESISWSVAQKAGIGSGEIVVSINGLVPKLSQDIIRIIQENKEFELTLWWDHPRTIRVTPIDGKVGMMIGYKDRKINENIHIQYRGIEAIQMGAKETIANTKITLFFLSRMVVWLFSPKNETEHKEAKDMLSGPIGLGSTFISIVRENVPFNIILVMIALISINLGVINILPFPALDGGRIVTTTLYSISSFFPNGKKYFSKAEWAIHTIGFIILLSLMLYVWGLDISRFF